MKRKLARLLGAVLTVCLTAGSVSPVYAAEEEKVFTVGWPYEASTMDPANASDDASYRAVRLYTEALLRLNGSEIEPGCAESYEVTDDHMEYVFHLREGLTFSDGTPITADTFRYTIERLLDVNGAYNNATVAYCIKNAEAYYNGECEAEDLGIEVVDDLTLKLTMEYPTYPQTFAIYSWAPVDQAAAEEAGIAYGAEAENMLGNGPFIVTEWVHDSEVVLEKNEAYWNADAVNFDKVVLKINAIGDTAVDMLTAGELDMADMKTALQTQTMLEDGYQTVESSNAVECIHINHAGKSEETGLFLGNANFRKALSYALDRDALVAAAYTTDQATTRFVGPSEQGVEGLFDEEYELEAWTTSADAEKAQECLEAALEELGKTKEDIPTFSILCYDSNANMTAMSAVIDMWSKTLGISCEIDAQPIQNMLQKMYSGDYDLWKGAISISGVDSLDLFNYYTTASALFNVNDEEYDALYDTAKNATSWEDRKDTLFELENYFCDQMLDIAVTWQTRYYVIGANVTGVTSDMLSPDFSFADFTD